MQADDIVARLRQFDADLEKEIADGEHGENGHLWVIPFDCILQAADRIEQLQAENATLRRLLDQFVGEFKDEVQREAL